MITMILDPLKLKAELKSEVTVRHALLMGGQRKGRVGGRFLFLH